MANYRVIKFGDYNGVGSIVEKSTLFYVRTFTVLPDDELGSLKKWTCYETGYYEFANGIAKELDNFYKAQHVLNEMRKQVND